jgi:NADPH:quinone reductase
MFAHQIRGFTGPDDVTWTEVAEPAAGGGVVIDVVAAGVSFADLLQTNGAYQMKVPLPYTPGMDAAGVIRSAPPDAGLAGGQRVAVLLSYGCWQEVIAAPAARVLPLPGDMSFQAGAAAPLNYLTALFALARRARRSRAKRCWCTARPEASAPPRSGADMPSGYIRSRWSATRPKSSSRRGTGRTTPC